MLFGVVVTLWAVLAAASASKGSSPLELKPEKYKDIPGCYLAEYDKVIPLGKEETMPDCVLYKCEDKWLEYYTCDITMNAPDCKLLASPDLTKPYPECCPVFKCFNSKTRTQNETF
ncbi:unnamed protein product [Arctia plantaginis]|uniref:Single domain-containing protein n=1 Tax=Arctia plantaginis TaxID=874455 RepID=A0A8S0YS28_ARCPL|nr:unnamed protein product [Arctia plantaginis]CAB3259306.1 unnamed protein product [Arctia plantaginis]